MRNYNIKAALFDLDGVIVFTDKYHYLAWKQLSDEQGWDFNETVNNRLRGIPRLASLEEILKHNNIDLPLEEKIVLMNRKNDYYVKLLEQINPDDVYPGSVEFIKKLRARGILISLCSSSKNAPLVLEKLGLTELFDAVVTGHDIKNAKPDPEIFLLGAKRLNMPVFHCVVFEDAKAGIEGARAARMKTVGVGNKEETEKLADTFIMSYD
ncbi:MAG: beta-phosphoglucomutase [Clostridia bacterium]|nr:beta-phosphoglucomutase [Clostridia bacterium]